MDVSFGTEVRELGRGLTDGSQRTADTTQWCKGLKGNSGAGRVKWDGSGVEVGIPGGINNLKGEAVPWEISIGEHCWEDTCHFVIVKTRDPVRKAIAARSCLLWKLKTRTLPLTDGCQLSA